MLRLQAVLGPVYFNMAHRTPSALGLVRCNDEYGVSCLGTVTLPIRG